MDEAQRLLDAEQATQDLLASLTHLKADMEGYSAAHKNMDAAVAELKQFLETAKTLTAQSAAVIETLKSLGMPEVLARTESLRAMLDALAASIQSQIAGIAVALEVRSQSVAEALQTKLTDAVPEVKKAVEQHLAMAASHSSTQIERLAEQHRNQTAEQVSTIHSRVDNLHADVRKSVIDLVEQAAASQESRLAEIKDEMRLAIQSENRSLTQSLASQQTLLNTLQQGSAKASAALKRTLMGHSIVIVILLLTIVAMLVVQMTVKK